MNRIPGKMTGRIHKNLLMMVTTGEWSGVLALAFFTSVMLPFYTTVVHLNKTAGVTNRNIMPTTARSHIRKVKRIRLN